MPSPKQPAATAVETTHEMIDFSRISAGLMPRGALNGAPVDFLLSKLYDKSGVPQSHPIRTALQFTHGSHAGKEGVEVLPRVFPPAAAGGDPDADPPINAKLETIQDWFDAIRPYTIRELPQRIIPAPAAVDGNAVESAGQ